MALHQETMSNVDAAWLHMDRPTNLMIIAGLMFFDEPLDFDKLRTVLEQRLLRFDRFRQRVVEARTPLGNPYWETDPHFDINAHLHRVGLPASGDDAALQAFVSDLVSAPLDMTKPLWHFHLIENYGSGCAVLGRMHHCIGDGIALMKVILSLCDDSPDAVWEETNGDVQGEERGWLQTLFRPVTAVTQTTRRLAGTLIHESMETLLHPTRPVHLAKLSADSATTLGKIIMRWPDPQTLFKGELGVMKKVAWSAPLSLADVKAVGRVTGGTVNDVLVTALAGSLRRYLIQREEAVDGLDVRAFIPVNLRPLEAPLELGNQFGLVFLALPLGIEDQVERLKEVKRRMDELKASPEAVVAIGVLQALGLAPKEIESLVVDFMATKATAVLTNVPGPRHTLYFAGAPLRHFMGWVPQSGGVGLGLSILSYAGEVMVGVVTDAGLVPDPEVLIEGFHIEFDGLMALVEMLEASEARQCQAMTQTGRQCRNRARPGSDFCHVHAKRGGRR